MSPRRLLIRSLAYHKSAHIAVALGVAVGSAVLAGALIVGDSVRGSLRDLTLDRLGDIHEALVADRYVREELASNLGGDTAPAILIRASVEAADSGARASKINLHGVDEKFWKLYEREAPELGLRDVLLNASLARELEVEEGGAVLLRFQTDTLVPAESVMGRKTDNVRTLRMRIARVIEDRGPGRFGLSPSQQLPLNAFVSLGSLQRALEQEGRVNALFAAQPVDLRTAVKLSDYELETRELSDPPTLSIQTRRIVLETPAAEAVQAAAQDAGLEAAPVLTYLANSIEAGERAIPYSTVTAIGGGEAFGSLQSPSGEAAPAISGDEILLNDWAARDLSAKVGDEIRLSYYVVGPRGELQTQTHAFTLKGVVRLTGLAADRDLAPYYEGMSDVERIGDWNPPFPVDLSLIRPADEDYWDRYRTAPKAFVPIETAEQLWTSRFGQLTSIRTAPKAGQDLASARTDFEAALAKRLDPAAFGLSFQPVREQGLEASSGATDFSGLFIGFSMFLIAAAAMLVSLLFRLGVERRARQVGLLLATGLPPGAVRKLLLSEGLIVAAIGCVIGLPGAVGYGALMVYGLTTWWSAAVGGSFLELHVTPVSLIGGAVGAFVLMGLSIWTSVRKLEKLSPRSMLAGALIEDSVAGTAAAKANRPKRIALGAAVLAAAMLAGSFGVDAAAQAGLFFGVAAFSLIAVLAYFRSRLLAPRRQARLTGSAPLWRLGARNSARFPTRSVLSAALVASAAFVIVVVSLMRHDVTSQEPDRRSGDGGFRFVAESDLPLFQDQVDQSEAPLTPFRVKLGEDASCLNLYRPSEPTLLGAPHALIERGGFAFQATLAETDAERQDPWLLLEKSFPDGAIPVFGDANSVMWILHLGLGKTLEVEDSQGVQRTLIIAGLMSRSIFQSELILSEPNFLSMFPDRGGFNTFLIETDDREAGLKLEKQWADLGFDAATTAERLAGYLVVENTYLSTFQTLGGLGLLLGTFGLAVVMVRNVIERRGELALLQAVGFGRGAVSRLVLSENAFLLVFGVASGTGTALLAVAPHLLSGMAEPPWASLSATLAVIVAVGLIAGAVAVAMSLRQPLLSSLRKE